MALADSVDGTHLAHCGVQRGLADVRGWLNAARQARLLSPPEPAFSAQPPEGSIQHSFLGSLATQFPREGVHR